MSRISVICSKPRLRVKALAEHIRSIALVRGDTQGYIMDLGGGMWSVQVWKSPGKTTELLNTTCEEHELVSILQGLPDCVLTIDLAVKETVTTRFAETGHEVEFLTFSRNDLTKEN